MGSTRSAVAGATRVVELRDGRAHAYDVTPEELGLEPRRATARARRHARAERRRCCATCSPASPGTERSLAVLNAGAAIYVGGRADSLAEGVRRPTRVDRRGRGAATCSNATWHAPGSSRPRDAVRLDDLVERHARAGRDGASASARSRSSSAEVAARERGPPVPRGAGAPRHVADRRAQAPLAVGGRDPRGRDRRRDRAAPTSAAAPPRCRSSPRRTTSAARSPTCARRARPRELPILRKDFTVDPYQLYEATARRRRRGAAGGRRRSSTPSWRASTRGPSARPRRAGRDPRRARSWSARWSSTST